MALQHLRSSTANKRPLPAGMSDGQLAINTNNTSPGLFFKDSAGALVKVGPVHVGTTAPNASPAGGGETGNSVGEQWLDTTGGTYVFKVWDGSAWRSESGTFVDVNGDTMTGALGIIAGTAGAPGLFASGDTNTGIYSPGADQLSIATGGTERLRIDSTGQIESVSLGTAAAPAFSFTGDPDTGIYSPAANELAISTNSTGRLFVDANGRVLTGTSTALNVNGTSDWQQQIAATGPVGILLSRFSNNTGPARINLLKSRSGSIGSNTIVSNGDVAGAISFLADDGTNYTGSVGEIKAEIDGVPGTGSLPGRIVFSTTPSGANGVVERLRITSAGLVGVGTSSVSANLDLVGSTSTSANNTITDAAFRVRSNLSGTENFAIRHRGASAGISGLNSTCQLIGSGTNAIELYTVDATPVVFGTSATERMRLTSTGLGIGTSAPGSILHLQQSASAAVGPDLRLANNAGTASDKARISFYGGTSPTVRAAYDFNINSSGVGEFIWSNGEGSLTERMRLDASGRLGIGTTSANTTLHVKGSGITTELSSLTYSPFVNLGTPGGNPGLAITTNQAAQKQWSIYCAGDSLAVDREGVERSRWDSSGRFLVGTSSARDNFFNTSGYGGLLQVEGANSNATRTSSFTYGIADTAGPIITLAKHRSNSIGGNTIVASGDQLGGITFQGSDGSEFVIGAQISAEVDATPGANDMPGRLVFSTTADGASSPTERMRISQNGRICLDGNDQTAPETNSATNGITFNCTSGSHVQFAKNNGAVAGFNRMQDDGTIIRLLQGGVEEGTISVSGTTVSYNGAHLSRWSQLPSGAKRTEILRGTVLSNIDEMCEWGDEDNEQLNRMKVSDVEGDKNVSGVFQAWDDDDDTYINDFYCAMTGDFIIRIGAGVTVERGDLLMSAGDGTAKPQDDDIIRSKTIAKVTSTNVTCTYEDGSYCVPCVLMAC